MDCSRVTAAGDSGTCAISKDTHQVLATRSTCLIRLFILLKGVLAKKKVAYICILVETLLRRTTVWQVCFQVRSQPEAFITMTKFVAPSRYNLISSDPVRRK